VATPSWWKWILCSQLVGTLAGRGSVQVEVL
jgi:hypothetical protein